MRVDRVTTEIADIVEAVRDLQYRLQLVFDTKEVFASDIKIRRKVQASISTFGKIDNYLTDAVYMYKTGNTNLHREDTY